MLGISRGRRSRSRRHTFITGSTEPPQLDIEASCFLPVSARRAIIEKACGFGPHPHDHKMERGYSICHFCSQRLRYLLPVCWACGREQKLTPSTPVADYLVWSSCFVLGVVLLATLFTNAFSLALMRWFY